MSEQENVAVVRRAYEDFKGGDIGGVLDSLTEEVEWRMPSMENVPFSGPRRGREGVAGFFSEMGGSQEPVSFEPREFVAQGDKVVALGTYRWRVKKNGREYGGDWVHVFTVRGGKITSFHEYMDSAAATAAYA